MHPTFGQLLQRWRAHRRLSQLDLALTANVSARHISFLESGRAQPSRPMVLQLCAALDVPRRDRNVLLEAAGFAPAYRQRALTDDELAPMREAMQWTLTRHEPYPAFILDRHWRLVRLNKPAELLLAAVGLAEGASLLDALSTDGPLRQAIENIDILTTHLQARLHTELRHLGQDEVIEQALGRLKALTQQHALVEHGDRRDRQTGHSPRGAAPVLIPTILRLGATRLSLLSTIAQFGTVEDLAVAELKIELLFPADAVTRAWLSPA